MAIIVCVYPILIPEFVASLFHYKIEFLLISKLIVNISYRDQ
jgi:hypothetical protein